MPNFRIIYNHLRASLHLIDTATVALVTLFYSHLPTQYLFHVLQGLGPFSVQHPWCLAYSVELKRYLYYGLLMIRELYS